MALKVWWLIKTDFIVWNRAVAFIRVAKLSQTWNKGNTRDAVNTLRENSKWELGNEVKS